MKESIIKDVLKDGCMRGLKIQMPEDSVMLGFRNTLATIKKPRSKKELFLKRATIMMAMRAPVPNIYSASKLLGTHRRNFYAAREKLKMESLPLHLCEQQVRTKDAISHEVKELVVSFWTENTRVSPNKKDVCRRRIKRKMWQKHPVHLLEQSQVIFFNFLMFFCTFKSILS